MACDEKTVIANFLSSLDPSLPMVEHFKNCLRDASVYKWNSYIVVKILEGIHKEYEEKCLEKD